jgi:nicotinate-nucleotide pyrophosphorylase (carboxylating)
MSTLKSSLNDRLKARNINPVYLVRTIRAALAEDVDPAGDVTSLATIPADTNVFAEFKVKQSGTLAGLLVAETVFALVDKNVVFIPRLNIHDGDVVEKGTVIATVNGNCQSILRAERIALNFLQRMSGIATLTKAYVHAARPFKAKILDTRKTVPGLRLTDKWAVRLGGGTNHRGNLSTMALIKDNHIDAVGGDVREAIRRVRDYTKSTVPIEVEVRTFRELTEALEEKPDRIMLDNMSLAQMTEAVKLCAGLVPLEASGGVTIKSVHAIAETGVDYISVGALTHSVSALDISMKIKKETP